MQGQSIQVKSVDRPDLHPDFMNLPAEIYSGDENWVPPLLKDIKGQLSPDGPFREYGSLQAFVAYRGNQPVGRIVASINRRLLQENDQTVGFFGYFDVEDNQETADALIDAATRWLKDNDCTVVRGPVNLSTHIDCLCLVEGFDTPPALMMPYNPEYYPRLLENSGLSKAKDAIAYDFPMSALSRVFERAYKRSLSAGITFRPVRLKGTGFEADCKSVYDVYSRSFVDNWSATPRSEAEFVEQAQGMRQIVDPSIFPIAEHNGGVVGFWMALPDYNIALRHVDGKLNLPGIIKLLWHRRKIDQARVLAVGVLPEYRTRAFAIGPALVYLGMIGGRDKNPPYRRAELSWVWEDNDASRKLIEASGGIPYKRYRIYEKQID